MKRQAGFTLIELMVVIFILAILVAITLPSLLRTRITANEGAAVEDLSMIATGQITYFAAKNTYGSFDDLVNGGASPESGFLDRSWVEGRNKSGYTFSIPAFSTTDFVCYADPVEFGITGDTYYRVDSSGIIRYSKDGRPTAEAPALGS